MPETKAVRGPSLCTIPYELECYIGLLILSLIGLARRPAFFAAIVAALSVGSTVWLNLTGSEIVFQVGPPGRLLVLSFLAGISIYLLRDHIRLGGPVTIASGVISILLLSFPGTMLLPPLPVALFTVSLGMMSPPRHPLLLSGDYSYGLYLFAYPIQQTYAALFPSGRFWYLNAAFAIFFGLLYAAFSWHLVEKQVLKRRDRIIQKLVLAPFDRLARIGQETPG